MPYRGDHDIGYNRNETAYRLCAVLTPLVCYNSTTTAESMKSLNFVHCLASNKRKMSLLTSCVHQYTRSLSVMKSSNQIDWNRVVSDAERVVGYTTSYLSLRCLLSDEISNLAAHVRKLVGTGHPLLKTAKGLIYNSKSYMDTRGLVVLLICKAAGHMSESTVNDPITDGISYRQRALAEITEMIHTAHQIHRGVVNVSSLIFPDKSTFQDMEFGNKIAVLCGDYLLASASKTLASLRHPDVVELITKATRDFTQAEFIGNHDIHGNGASIAGMTVADWEEKNYLLSASLLAQSCQAALVLAKHDEKLQKNAFEFGKNVALAWQIYSELLQYTDTTKHPTGTPLDLTGLPVLMHIKDDSELLNYITSYKNNLENVDFKLVREVVLNGTGIKQTQELCHNYAQKSLASLNSFNNSDANLALRKMIDFL
uniref:Decaprenyl-diphosphate synthase subunit 2 n=1 Tax=Strigamia maritima TaxID=126957 RepID=T1JCC4_STRMM